MSGTLDTSITLTQLLAHWVEKDPILRDHFAVRGVGSGTPPAWQGTYYGRIQFDCVSKRPKLPPHIVRHLGDVVVKIYDDRVTVVFGTEDIYKFQACHPMFFQKLRGHVYDMHNRHYNRCKEYLR